MSHRPVLHSRALEYCGRRALVIGQQLGFGVHGLVFQATDETEAGVLAIKVHERETDYCRERDVYVRLQNNDVAQIRGFNVPLLIDYDDDLLVIEMTLVRRPFVLDFAGAYLDYAPEFPDDVMVEWYADKQEQFGANWPEAQAVLRELEGLGIYVIDVHPKNIAFDE